MPKVALIFPYFRTRSLTEMLFPPLGLANLTSQLRGLGIDTKIFDCTFETFRRIRKKLREYGPDIVGIYSMITMSRNTFRIAQTVREALPDCLLVAGGPLPTLYPERYAGLFDAVFRGESDLSFPRFCHDYFEQGIERNKPVTGLSKRLEALVSPVPEPRTGAGEHNSYEGLYIQKAGLEVNNPTIHYNEEELGTFPLPDRRDFDHTTYQKTWLETNGTKTTSIITTLGCPYSCDFCSRPVFGNLFRRRNLDAVFEEIEQIKQFGYDSLWIADDTFTLNHAHLEAFCQRIASRKLSWSCLSRSNNVNEEMTRMMKEAGCQRVYLGLETGDQDTLRLMNKRATVEDGINAVEKFNKAGIEVAAFFIVGYPGETIQSIEKTFRLALTLPLDYISFNVPFPLPGSNLFERVSEIDTSKDWNTENEVTFVYHSEFDTAWLRRRIRQTMKAFAEKRD